jgi:hypothetical protein
MSVNVEHYVTVAEELPAMRERVEQVATRWPEVFNHQGVFNQLALRTVSALVANEIAIRLDTKEDTTETIDHFACEVYRRVLLTLTGIAANEIERQCFGHAAGTAPTHDLAVLVPEWYYGVNKGTNLG